MNGLVSIGRGASEVLAPALAGLLIGVIGVAGVILIDVVTFLFAVAVLLIVRFPHPTADGSEPSGATPRLQNRTVRCKMSPLAGVTCCLGRAFCGC